MQKSMVAIDSSSDYWISVLDIPAAESGPFLLVEATVCYNYMFCMEIKQKSNKQN